MAPGFLTGDGGNDILGLDRRLVVVVVLVGVVAIGGAAVMFTLGGDSGHESNAQLDSVPADVDGLVYIDGNVTDDQMTLDMLNEGLEVAWWALDSGEAPEMDLVLETLDTENIEYDNTTVFLRGPENGSANYAGSVVNLGEGSNAMDMVELLEAEVGEDQLQQDTYSGVDIYELDVVEAAEQADVEGVTDELDVTGILQEFVGAETTAWIATPTENTVILGSEAAASDAIDVRQGEADPVGGELRDTHERAEPGPVEATVSPDIVDQPINEVAGVVSSDAQAILEIAGREPQQLALTYNVRDREQDIVTFDVVATMENSDAAGELFSAMETFVEDPETPAEDPEVINDTKAIRRSAADRNGKYLHLEIPTLTLQSPTYIAQFVDAYAPAPDPLQMVPREADGVLAIDGNATGDQTTLGLADDAFAEGLVAGTEGTTTQDVLGAINAGEVNYTSMTTFYSDDSEDYVGTYVELDKDPNEFIESEVRSAYIEKSDNDDIPFREFHKGYRHVDIYDVSDLDEELTITRALSGFVADGTTEWLAPITDNSFVFGSVEAVQDVADIYRGVEAPGETPLHAAHNRTDGQIVLTGNVSDKPVEGYADAVDGQLGDALADQSAQVLSASYDVSDAGDVSLDVQFRAADEAAAGDLTDALDAAVEGGEGDAVHQRASVSQDGQYVHMSVPYEADQLVGDAAAFVDEFGTELFPGSAN
jgi:hypothetical protein